jgi:hypothetical protein
MPPSAQEPLLDFLFLTIARKLPPISLREGAAVARYLHSLAWDFAAGDDRKALDRTSGVIWGIVSQRARFRTAEKKTVIGFLQKNAHLVRLNIDQVLALVRSLPEPKPHVAPPMLSGLFTAGPLGAHRARLEDDLTERIAAGYWALRHAKVPKASTLVAAALNLHQVPRGSRDSETVWSAYDVQEKVKQYDRVLAKQSSDVKRGRQWLVDKWRARWGSATPAPNPPDDPLRTDPADTLK